MNIWSSLHGRLLSTALLVLILPLVTGVVNPEIRFMPIRTAPLGSPAGTVGDPVEPPVLNTTLSCWEILVPAGGIEVDLDLQGFGWGNATGSPSLGAIQGTLDSTGLDNGSGPGTRLLPKGWPVSPSDGAYQARNICQGPDGDGSPCTTPFDFTCGGLPEAFCAHSPAWVMPACAQDLPAIATPTLDYGWATASQNQCADDDGLVKTFGGLILDVPAAARGTYVIAVVPDPNSTFMTAGTGQPIVGVVFTAACITIQCQEDADCADGLDCTTDQCNPVTSTCEAVVLTGSCAIDGQCIVSGTEDPTDSCRLCDPDVSATSWTPRPQGTPCGDPTDTTCNGADQCNRAGVCLDRVQPAGTACDDEGNECTDDVCSSGVCTHDAVLAGTLCGDPTDTACDRPDTCNATGTCATNVMEDLTPCPNGSFCDGAESCLGGTCQAGDPPCDPEAQICDEPGDTCDLLGDYDGDLVVTLSDYLHWVGCETGPTGGPYAPGCEIFDFEPNGFVDLRDYARFQSAFDLP